MMILRATAVAVTLSAIDAFIGDDRRLQFPPLIALPSLATDIFDSTEDSEVFNYWDGTLGRQKASDTTAAGYDTSADDIMLAITGNQYYGFARVARGLQTAVINTYVNGVTSDTDDSNAWTKTMPDEGGAGATSWKYDSSAANSPMEFKIGNNVALTCIMSGVFSATTAGNFKYTCSYDSKYLDGSGGAVQTSQTLFSDGKTPLENVAVTLCGFAADDVSGQEYGCVTKTGTTHYDVGAGQKHAYSFYDLSSSTADTLLCSRDEYMISNDADPAAIATMDRKSFWFAAQADGAADTTAIMKAYSELSLYASNNDVLTGKTYFDDVGTTKRGDVDWTNDFGSWKTNSLAGTTADEYAEHTLTRGTGHLSGFYSTLVTRYMKTYTVGGSDYNDYYYQTTTKPLTVTTWRDAVWIVFATGELEARDADDANNIAAQVQTSPTAVTTEVVELLKLSDSTIKTFTFDASGNSDDVLKSICTRTSKNPYTNLVENDRQYPVLGYDTTTRFLTTEIALSLLVDNGHEACETYPTTALLGAADPTGTKISALEQAIAAGTHTKDTVYDTVLLKSGADYYESKYSWRDTGRTDLDNIKRNKVDNTDSYIQWFYAPTSAAGTPAWSGEAYTATTPYEYKIEVDKDTANVEITTFSTHNTAADPWEDTEVNSTRVETIKDNDGTTVGYRWDFVATPQDKFVVSHFDKNYALINSTWIVGGATSVYGSDATLISSTSGPSATTPAPSTSTSTSTAAGTSGSGIYTYSALAIVLMIFTSLM